MKLFISNRFIWNEFAFASGDAEEYILYCHGDVERRYSGGIHCYNAVCQEGKVILNEIEYMCFLFLEFS